jgi:hypothetical protein
VTAVEGNELHVGVDADEAFDELALRLDAALDCAGELELRRLFCDVVGRRFRAASGLRVMLSIRALRAFAEDVPPDMRGGSSDLSPEHYERWRAEQEVSREWPSRRFVFRCFGESWTAGLDAAELPVCHGRRARQQLMRKRESFTSDEMLAVLRSWLADGGTTNDTFAAYRAWAIAQLTAGRAARLPISAPTVRRAFGTWAHAVAIADGDSSSYGRGRSLDAGRAYRRLQLLDQLRRAALETGMWSRLTRRAHDDWVKARAASEPAPPGAVSETIRRRFGSWHLALTAAGLR